MKTVTKKYQVYSFDELDQAGKDKAIDGEIQFWIETSGDDDNTPPEILRAFKKADAMQTPWFVGGYVFEYAKEIIIDGCQQYDYLADGTIFTV
jgi:hypothetical protein